jgi:O-antigen/teichoic acid export membrane protein
MKGDAVVGWYNAAFNLVSALRQVPFLFGVVLLPLMSRSFVSSIETLKLVYEKSVYYLCALGLPLATGTALLADRIIHLFYGAQFAPSTIALRILSLNMLLLFFNSPLSMLLVSINRHSQMAAAGVTSMIVNVALNLILIPPLGYVGAGIASVVTQILLSGYYFYLASKHVSRLRIPKLLEKPAISCAPMAIFLYFASGLNLLVLVTASIAIYFAVFLLIGGFTRGDLKLIRGIAFPTRA